MTAAQALTILDRVMVAGFPVWVDGGWGVDALLEVQSRAHGDLDLVVALTDLGALEALFTVEGFSVERDLAPTARAMRHTDGRGIDFHLVNFTADGGADQVLEDRTVWHYGPPASGRIAGRPVTCCSVSTQIRAHLGYEPDDADRADMHLLAARFGVTLPAPYA